MNLYPTGGGKQAQRPCFWACFELHGALFLLDLIPGQHESGQPCNQ